VGHILLLQTNAQDKYFLPGGTNEDGRGTLLALSISVLNQTGLEVTRLVDRVHHNRLLFAHCSDRLTVQGAFDQEVEVYIAECFTDDELLDDDQVNSTTGKPHWVPIAELRPEMFSDHWVWRAVETAVEEQGLEHLLPGYVRPLTYTERLLAEHETRQQKPEK